MKTLGQCLMLNSYNSYQNPNTSHSSLFFKIISDIFQDHPVLCGLFLSIISYILQESEYTS